MKPQTLAQRFLIASCMPGVLVQGILKCSSTLWDRKSHVREQRKDYTNFITVEKELNAMANAVLAVAGASKDRARTFHIQ